MKGMEQRNSSIEIYRSPEGNIELNVKLENDTVWLTQSQMAEMCGISVRRYQELEQGHSLPLLSTAVRMAAAFDLSLDSLKGEVK